MDEVFAVFALIMTGMAFTAWLVNGMIKRRQQAHAGPDQETLAAVRQVDLLADQNAGLKGQVARLEERLSVIERIVTDPAERTARDIELLR